MLGLRVLFRCNGLLRRSLQVFDVRIIASMDTVRISFVNLTFRPCLD